MQALFFSPQSSPRLQYTCSFILRDLLLLDFSITNDPEEFKLFKGIKIYYGNETVVGDHISIGNHGLLFETGINVQKIECFNTGNYIALFEAGGYDLPFDIFSAAFYLVSRYEEYLPHEKDNYGRYSHKNSIAFKENFLHLPLVNTWVKHLGELIQKKYPRISLRTPGFSFLATYDIDIAFSYRHKGLLRNMGGFLKSPSLQRIAVLLRLKDDPFDSYKWLNQLHRHYNLQPLYFFLVAKNSGLYDKNISPDTKAMRLLIQQHAKKYLIGIHPSWQSGDDAALLQSEKQQLEAIIKTPVTISRQHYIRFNLPGGYRQLIGAGITDDYSMGYGSINGFRASVAASFYWYDLQQEQATALRIHPFCFMDANAFYEQQLTPLKAAAELMEYYSICKEVNGRLITIWHNNFLGDDPQFAGWKLLYKQFIIQLKSASWNLKKT
ncbi:MAG: polysaccharide deacetylase family protein [Ferruginibacter sp.]